MSHSYGQDQLDEEQLDAAGAGQVPPVALLGGGGVDDGAAQGRVGHDSLAAGVFDGVDLLLGFHAADDHHRQGGLVDAEGEGVVGDGLGAAHDHAHGVEDFGGQRVDFDAGRRAQGGDQGVGHGGPV